jgi:hypothetical protein
LVELRALLDEDGVNGWRQRKAKRCVEARLRPAAGLPACRDCVAVARTAEHQAKRSPELASELRPRAIPRTGLASAGDMTELVDELSPFAREMMKHLAPALAHRLALVLEHARIIDARLDDLVDCVGASHGGHVTHEPYR